MAATPAVADLVVYLARQLVEQPDAVEVEQTEREGAIVLRLRVAPDDVGKVIGKGGRVIRALRSIVRAGSARERQRIYVEVAEE